jgi:aminoglycoside 3-N-acetyltransferase
MPSSPYTGSTEDYLSSAEGFDVCHTPSRMGMISEIFRRQGDTERSLNPAHPILASGRLASWFVEGHEGCTYSCGPGSPFEKLLETDAKALFFDVELANLMFFHYLEHVVKDMLPFELYDPKVYQVTVIDPRGRQIVVPVRAFSKTARASRRFGVLETELRLNNMIQSCRIGNTRLALVRIRDALEITQRLLGRGKYFYDLTTAEHAMRP